MKRIINLIVEAVVFFFEHNGESRDSRRWEWENRHCPNNRAKWKRKERELAHLEHERFLKATGRV